MTARATRRPVLALLLGGALAATALCRAAQAQAQTPAPAPAPAHGLSVAVWDFDHHAVDGPNAPALAHVSRALCELLIEQLLAYPGVQVIERSHLREILDEQKLGSSALADDDARLRLGRLAGAQNMVFGSLLQIGDMARIDVRLVSVATSQVLAAQEVSGPLQDLGAGMESLAQALASGLGSVQAAASGNGAPVSAATLERFDAGLALMDQKNYAAALESFEALVKMEPGFGPAARQIPIALEKLARQ